ncbi:MAG: NAD-dependent epimerase/dehydratase family protein [Dehalococcoidales bacterium]|nr:MAG: NAD-dependent epimerase/dehydratase family protein [Dehalococcoidales bacterium]
MKAIVTGASGHLGANLIRTLISRNWDVKALIHRDTRALEGLGIELVHGDILDVSSLKNAFQGEEIVFHLAARISVIKQDRRQVEEMNIDGVRNVIDSCLSTGVKRLVHVSSFHAHIQEPLDEILDETRQLVNTKNYPPYNYSKAEGERLVQEGLKNGLEAIIITPTGIIGPYDFQPSHFGSTILAIALKKLRILVDAGLDWVDARDVSEGMITAAEKAGPGEKFILSGHRVTLRNIADYITGYMDQSPVRIVLPFYVARLCAPTISAFDRIRGERQLFTPISIDELNSNRHLSCEKASIKLGYNPRPLKETITDTLDWFKENGYLPNCTGVGNNE